jgi:hypothetical protein
VKCGAKCNKRTAFDFTSNFFHTEQYALINASKALPQQKLHISIENLDFQTASKKGIAHPVDSVDFRPPFVGMKQGKMTQRIGQFD